jgi:hypothetical protein
VCGENLCKRGCERGQTVVVLLSLSLSLRSLLHVLSFLLSDSLGGKEREGGRGRTSEGARPQKKENNRRETSVDSRRERFETME